MRNIGESESNGRPEGHSHFIASLPTVSSNRETKTVATALDAACTFRFGGSGMTAALDATVRGKEVVPLATDRNLI